MWIDYKYSKLFTSIKRVAFDAIVDHLTLTHIINSNMEPATTKIKRLLELISSYSFNLYYMKGKDMILSDFLSRQNNDDSNLHDIIPISFNMYQILNDNYYNEKYLVQTRSQAKSSSTKLLEVHGMRKKFRSQSQARKTSCHAQKWKYRKAMHRSRKSGIKKKET